MLRCTVTHLSWSFFLLVVSKLLIPELMMKFVVGYWFVAVDIEEIKKIYISRSFAYFYNWTTESWSTDNSVVFMNLKQTNSHDFIGRFVFFFFEIQVVDNVWVLHVYWIVRVVTVELEDEFQHWIWISLTWNSYVEHQ